MGKNDSNTKNDATKTSLAHTCLRFSCYRLKLLLWFHKPLLVSKRHYVTRGFHLKTRTDRSRCWILEATRTKCCWRKRGIADNLNGNWPLWRTLMVSTCAHARLVVDRLLSAGCWGCWKRKYVQAHGKRIVQTQRTAYLCLRRKVKKTEWMNTALSLKEVIRYKYSIILSTI